LTATDWATDLATKGLSLQELLAHNIPDTSWTPPRTDPISKTEENDSGTTGWSRYQES
jgi:hypothetical protein